MERDLHGALRDPGAGGRWMGRGVVEAPVGGAELGGGCTRRGCGGGPGGAAERCMGRGSRGSTYGGAPRDMAEELQQGGEVPGRENSKEF